MVEKIKNKFDITFFKFILVGIINTVVGTAVMFIAYNVFHLSYWVSSAANHVADTCVVSRHGSLAAGFCGSRISTVVSIVNPQKHIQQ